MYRYTIAHFQRLTIFPRIKKCIKTLNYYNPLLSTNGANGDSLWRIYTMNGIDAGSFPAVHLVKNNIRIL